MTKTYRPSNGSEGMDFMDTWCAQCSVQAICKIWPATMAYHRDDPKYPTQWQYDEEGNPVCISFSERASNRNPPRCKHTMEMFA